MFRNTSTGYAIWSSPDGKKETDTITCCHCNRVVYLHTGDDTGGWCLKCAKATCAKCALLGCTPLEKWIEAQESKRRLVEAILG